MTERLSRRLAQRLAVDDYLGIRYAALIFVAATLVVGYAAYRVVRDRDGAPDPVDALVGKK